MTKYETDYYEFDGFWNPAANTLGRADYERVEHIIDLIPSDVTSLLDVGCGNGIFVNRLSARRPEIRVVGADRSRTALQYVTVEHYEASIDALPFPDRSFDAVVSLEVLEHLAVDTFTAATAELTRVADRSVIVSVPYHQRLGTGQTQCPSCRTRFDPDIHLRSFTDATMKKLLTQHGWGRTFGECYGNTTTYAMPDLWHALERVLGKPSMMSPICPLCGCKNPSYGVSAGPQGFLRRAFKAAAARLWPRTMSPRWILAVYNRIENATLGDNPQRLTPPRPEAGLTARK